MVAEHQRCVARNRQDRREGVFRQIYIAAIGNDAVRKRNVRTGLDKGRKGRIQRPAAVVERDRLRRFRAEPELRGIDRRAVRHHERSFGKRGLLRARGAKRERARAFLCERAGYRRVDRGRRPLGDGDDGGEEGSLRARREAHRCVCAEVELDGRDIRVKRRNVARIRKNGVVVVRPRRGRAIDIPLRAVRPAAAVRAVVPHVVLRDDCIRETTVGIALLDDERRAGRRFRGDIALVRVLRSHREERERAPRLRHVVNHQSECHGILGGSRDAHSRRAQRVAASRIGVEIERGAGRKRKRRKRVAGDDAVLVEPAYRRVLAHRERAGDAAHRGERHCSAARHGERACRALHGIDGRRDVEGVAAGVDRAAVCVHLHVDRGVDQSVLGRAVALDRAAVQHHACAAARVVLEVPGLERRVAYADRPRAAGLEPRPLAGSDLKRTAGNDKRHRAAAVAYREVAAAFDDGVCGSHRAALQIDVVCGLKGDRAMVGRAGLVLVVQNKRALGSAGASHEQPPKLHVDRVHPQRGVARGVSALPRAADADALLVLRRIVAARVVPLVDCVAGLAVKLPAAFLEVEGAVPCRAVAGELEGARKVARKIERRHLVARQVVGIVVAAVGGGAVVVLVVDVSIDIAGPGVRTLRGYGRTKHKHPGKNASQSIHPAIVSRHRRFPFFF